MPKMRILIGPPACGKSTYRKQLVEQGWSYVNNDEIREKFPSWKERQVLDEVQRMAKHYMSFNNDIVIDNTNLNPKTVARWMALGRSFNYDIDIKRFFDIPWQEAVQRDALRPNPVGKSVIMQMYMDAEIFTDIAREVVIFDLDGTICDISHRRHYVFNADNDPNFKKDWKSFYGGICNDMPNPAVVEMYDLVRYSGRYDVIFMSGRGSEYRSVSEQWLEKFGLTDYHMLIMRPYNDSRTDWIVKKELYEKYVKPYYNVKFTVDDRLQVCRMWHSIGLPIFRVGDPDADF